MSSFGYEQMKALERQAKAMERQAEAIAAVAKALGRIGGALDRLAVQDDRPVVNVTVDTGVVSGQQITPPEAPDGGSLRDAE